jgi:myo-inositol 2-dehydrogenase/D-chiro-inositol 1-dehydrogenase
MNFLILGDGPLEHAWARVIAESGTHHVLSAFPALTELPDIRAARDLDDALATPGVDAVLVGGAPEIRAESLRRVAASGLPAICLHPPGPDSEAYYQVAMSRAETGSILVPDLANRLHPGVLVMRDALQKDELGTFRSLRFEATANPESLDLARYHFARAVDVVRALLGEIEAVTATGDPPGDRPNQSLVVQLRASLSRRAELRFEAGSPRPSRLILTGESGSLGLEINEGGDPPPRLYRKNTQTEETFIDLDPWEPLQAVLNVFEEAVTGLPRHPDLLDATRAMEVSEGVVRALRRGRTVELHYEEISEAGTFKSVMTSAGCLMLLAILFVVPLALAGPPLGLWWTIYFAYLIPPILVVYVLLQLLRFALRDPRKPAEGAKKAAVPLELGE